MRIEEVTEWQLTPVLADEYYQEVEKELVYITEITDKRETSRLIKDLCTACPLPGLMHLKRVRWTPFKNSNKIEILLLPVSNINISKVGGQVETELVLADININTHGLANCANIQVVPKTAPLTRKQYEIATDMWPTQFHEDKYVSKVLNDQLFTEKDKQRIENYMLKAINTAKEAKSCSGAVIVDPSTDTIVCIGVDLRHRHPLQHAIMVAIDLVAKSQQGGAWDMNDPCLYVKGSQEKNESSDSKTIPYLCTGYELYVTREPCTMCSMALVHSRIKRVFYGCSTPWGKLGTSFKLHTCKGLNHHYEVWQGVLKTQCKNISDQFSAS